MGLTDPSISLLGRSSLLVAPHRVSDRLSMTACGASQTSRDQVAVTSRDYSRQTSLEAGDFGVVAGAPTRGRQWSRARRPATVSPPAPSIQAARHYAPGIELFGGAIFWTEHSGQRTFPERHARRQLLAKAAIAAWRVGSYPCAARLTE